MSLSPSFPRYTCFHLLFFVLCLAPVLAARPRKVFAHYLPWYDSAGVKYSARTGWCYPDGSTYDCKDPSIVHYSNKPLIGEYTLFDTHVLEYHFLLLHAADVDGIIININPDNPMQRDASLFILDSLLKFNALHSAVDLKVIISYDDGSNKSQDTVTELLTWVYQNIYNNPAYSSLVFIDPETTHPVLLGWSESDIEHSWNTVQSLFSKAVLFIIRNPHMFQYSSGNFEWVNYLNTGLPKTNTKNWGLQAFDDMDWAMARQSTMYDLEPSDVNTVKMGGVYPGFDDENVPPFWNGGTNRYILRNVDEGDTMALTWQMQIKYKPLRLGGEDEVDNPWVQITTWNDWPEGSSVEPATADTYGYTALETCRQRIAEFKGLSPPYEAACLQVPYSVYQKRKAGDDAAADLAVVQLLAGECKSV